MPRIYKQNCKNCGTYYESAAKFYCSPKCSSSDPMKVKKFTEFMRSDKNPNLGRKWSEEQKKKISESEKGKIVSLETREKVRKIVKQLWENPEYKKNMSLAHVGKRTGKAHWNWQGGLTDQQTVIRHSFEHKQWSRLVLARDDYTCQICGKRGGNQHANHIKKFANYPELRFVLVNGITLCENCHMKQVNHHEEEWESYFNFNLMTRGFLPDNNWKEAI